MDQHFVPRVYLKQFESSRKMLYILHNKAHKHSPDVQERTRTQLGYLPDFYTIKNERTLKRLGLSDKDVIEKKFNARFENRFEKILLPLLAPSRMIPLHEAEEVLLMLLSMKQRNPMFRRAFENPQTIIDAFERRFNEVLEHRPTFEEILKREGRMDFDRFVEYGREYIHQFAHDPNTPQDMHVEGIVKMHQNEDSVMQEVASSLMNFEWFIFETLPHRPFISSDNPGFCIDNNEQVYNLNFADSTGFFFPFSPSYLLMITSHFIGRVSSVKQIHRRPAAPELVRILNRATFTMSYKKVVSNDENTLRFVWNDMSRFIPHLNDAPVYEKKERIKK